MTIKIVYLVIINILSFILMGLDKYKAINNHWRISEYTFFGLALLGGSFGTLIAMPIFQNKTKKTPLRVSFCFIGIARLDKTLTCVSCFALRVTPCGVISKSRVIRYAHGVI